ncbi:Hpt domain-containing protein [Gimesia fumaroli]|jgi:HPt (histidine-containing phosphotransfer) domain-containing protein|uniref:Hpt domain protein n=1 Tax=Gimesia fumaroli TaxID=2527976 RepID=A0A518II95_9PLAN|nr:Hpt domain-containing protein [Gimesia fumaroli]QDV52809.1 Hpt domain protein [Gimesia fumaroli]
MTSLDLASTDGQWRLINREQVLDMAVGDVEFLAEMIELFFSYVPQQMNDIKQAVENNDSQELAEAAHACKGTVGNYTKLEPYLLLQALENDGKSEQLDESQIKYNSLEKEISQLIAELKTLMAQECSNV